MRKNKKKLRAQRKFAQGAFIPPQNNPSTSALASATPHAHRAVSAPGPVMVNGCSVQDLLTRTSLGKAHNHHWLPVVSLEYDYGKVHKDETPKKKIKEKKNLKASPKKKRNMLRNRRKSSLNLPNARRVSVSDSGEDTPLSYLMGSRMVIATNADGLSAVHEPSNTMPSMVVDSTTTAGSVVMEETTTSSDMEKTNGHLHKSSSLIPVILSVDTDTSEPENSILYQMSGLLRKKPHSSNESQVPPSDCTMMVNDVQEHATELSPSFLTPGISNERSSSDYTTGHEQIRDEPILIATSRKSLRLKRTTKPYQDREYLYDFPDIASLPSYRQAFDSKSGDPESELSTNSTIASSINLRSKKYRALKRKSINNERDCNQVTKRKTESKVMAPLKHAPLDCEVDKTMTMQMEAHNDQPAFSTSSTCASLNTPNMSNEQTAEWVRAHYQVDVPAASSPIPESKSFVPEHCIKIPDSSSLNMSEGIGLRVPKINAPSYSSFMVRCRSSSVTAPRDKSLSAPSSSSAAPSVSIPGQQTGAGNHFKMPELPARFAKLTKNCPTRLLSSLQDLLNSQPTEKDSYCNLCRRCELLSKYKKVASRLPVSDANEPDILDMPPHDVYEFDSDEGGIKFLRRGRELVRNVLTTKRFPIWMCNLEMNLKKTMFKDEHKLGTLKRSITFEKDDVNDAMVNKVITRVDYLARCIAEDKKELDLERSRQRLRSSKRTPSSMDQRRKVLRPHRRVPRLRRNPRPSAHTAVSTMQAEGSMNLPAETSLTEARHLVLRLTPLEDVPELVKRSTPQEEVSELVERSTREDVRELVGRLPALDDVRVLVERLTPLEDVPELVEQRGAALAPPGTDATPLTEGRTKPATRLYSSDASEQSSASVKSHENLKPRAQQSDLGKPAHRNMHAVSTDRIQTLGLPVISSPLPDEDEQSFHLWFDTSLSTIPPDQEDFDDLVFRPTLEEFMDPIAYIENIEASASKFGICKIIPPKGFNVPCHLDDNCMFTTINQYLGRLYQRWGQNTREMTTIQTYVTMLANPRERDQFTKAPMLDGVELDLVKLYQLVLEHGGIEELLAHRERWARIAEQMSLVSPRGKPDPKKLEKLYCKHVLPYESLTHYDRKIIRNKVDKVWKERVKGVTRRAKRPLHDKQRMLGETFSDDDEEPPSDPETREVRIVGKPCFDRAEECTGTHKGRPMNLATFRRIAAQIQAMRFPNESAPSTHDVEEAYWSILSLSKEHVCVLSAFIDTSVDSLGHPSDPAAPGGNHPWNLKRLSENPRNILRSLGKTLSVTVPTLCLNQLFSTNCWHMDPHQLAWMDYMHEGSTKIWYAVAQSDASKFRRAVEVLIPSAVQNKGIWLTSDTTMIPPGMLLAHGVPLRRLEQRPGEFIVVFPGAYASSIATGLTISECIYFESKRWLYNIDRIFQAMQQDCEPAMFSSTLLLLRMAREPELSPDALMQVFKSIKALLVEEFKCRRDAAKFKCKILLDQSNRSDGEQAPVSWPNQEECSICRAPLILSKSCRYNEPRSLTCLDHGLTLFSVAGSDEYAAPPPVTLLYSNQELQSIIDTLKRRAMELVTSCNRGGKCYSPSHRTIFHSEPTTSSEEDEEDYS